MFKKKSLFAVAVAALSIVGLVACGDSETQDYEQNTKPFESPTLTVSIVGGDYANWSPADSIKSDSKCLFAKIDSSHYQLVTTCKVGSEFKFVQDGGWSTQYGVEDMDWNRSTPGFVKGTAADYNEGTGNRSNFEPLISGTMTVDFYPYFFADKTLNNPLVITVK